MMKTALIFLIFLMFSSVSFAQKSKKTRKAEVNFEDELITGDVNKPELLYLLKQRQNEYKKLIKFRPNFLPEMRKTSEFIKQSRGQ